MDNKGHTKGTRDYFREKILTVADRLFERMADDLDELEPRDRVNAAIKLYKVLEDGGQTWGEENEINRKIKEEWGTGPGAADTKTRPFAEYWNSGASAKC